MTRSFLSKESFFSFQTLSSLIIFLVYFLSHFFSDFFFWAHHFCLLCISFPKSKTRWGHETANHSPGAFKKIKCPICFCCSSPNQHSRPGCASTPGKRGDSVPKIQLLLTVSNCSELRGPFQSPTAHRGFLHLAVTTCISEKHSAGR